MMTPYSRLDSIFRTSFRHTETTDAWLGIRRDEGQDTRRKKQHKEEEKDSDSLWEDSTSISVSALKAFLGSLIKDGTEEPYEETAEEKPQEDPSPRKPSGQTARAAQAYQTTARATDHTDEVVPQQDAGTRDQTTTVELSVEEKQVIQQLLVDLEVLAKQNIEQVTIQKAPSFLESLVRAVQKAKGG